MYVPSGGGAASNIITQRSARRLRQEERRLRPGMIWLDCRDPIRAAGRTRSAFQCGGRIMQRLNWFFGVLALLPLFILAATPDRVQAQCEAARFVGSDTAARDRFGSSLSVDGDLLVVGAPEANCPEFGCSDAGAAYVFRLDDNATPADPSDDQWMQEAKLVASDAASYEKLGRSVSVKGTVVLVGASWSECSTVPNSYCGAAYV